MKILSLFFKQKTASTLDFLNKSRLFFIGFLANIFDTLGIGSFAVIIAFNKHWKLIDDKKLPGTLNAQAVLASFLQAMFFLKFVEIDFYTLASLVLSACLGGFIGGIFISGLQKQTTRLIMSIGFFSIALLVLGNQMGIFPIGGEKLLLEEKELYLGSFLMLLAGMLPSIGIGIYAPIQVILFFLGLSPLAAFPIMTTIGVIVQSSTALAFLYKKETALEETIILTLGGILGVLLAIPLVALIDASSLRWLLFLVVVYNAISMWKNYTKEKKCNLTNPIEKNTEILEKI